MDPAGYSYGFRIVSDDYGRIQIQAQKFNRLEVLSSEGRFEGAVREIQEVREIIKKDLKR